jgi:hypothetical protein
VVPPEGHQELSDWATVAEVGTAGGTLVLAIATVGSSERSADDWP